ncbi:hypothetical protein KUTeg_016519 [Tegillarca granosa]|uniref:Uncharacterized protein n=1 Tax=Tegillarca granosa TaxID=220873 RepID=A0ABQ9EL32_TEGGR|nr:hypothetical protein KUTeg_016519 [Tegillarca granosa]
MSSILEQPNVSDSMPCANNTSHHADETHTSKDALFYIITVLMFYACSIKTCYQCSNQKNFPRAII